MEHVDAATSRLVLVEGYREISVPNAVSGVAVQS